MGLLKEIALEAISLSPHQMRRHFPEEEIEELAQSIESVGLIQPLVVRLSDGAYELIAGERRLRALKLLNKNSALAFVSEMGDKGAACATLIENIQRSDLRPMEESWGYQNLMKRLPCTQQELSKLVGKKRSTIANSLRLLSLPKEVQEAIDAGAITVGHAKLLLSLPTQILQLSLYRKIVQEGLTVRKTEELIRISARRPKRMQQKSPYLLALERQLQETLSLPIRVVGSEEGGKIIFDWDSVDALETLLEHFGVLSDG